MVLYKCVPFFKEIISDVQGGKQFKQHQPPWHIYRVNSGHLASPLCFQICNSVAPGTGCQATCLSGIFFSGSRLVCWILKIRYLLARLCLFTQSCLTLCNPMDYSPPGSCNLGDSPDKNARVGCHFLFQCMKVKSESGVVAQSCPTYNGGLFGLRRKSCHLLKHEWTLRTLYCEMHKQVTKRQILDDSTYIKYLV